jgi:hypothetical protein
MSVIDQFQLLVRWRPDGLRLAEAADRMAQTLRFVAGVWPECAAWRLGSTAVEVDDPALAQRLLPVLRSGRTSTLYGDSDGLGDADAGFYPAPRQPVAVLLSHDNPKPTLGQVVVRAQDGAAARLTERPDAFPELLRALVVTWGATLAHLAPREPRGFQPFGYDWRPYFGWATYLAKDLASVTGDVAVAVVTETAGGQLIVLHDRPDAIRRESIDALIAHTYLADGTPLRDLPT